MPEKNKCETEKKKPAEEKSEKDTDVWSEDQKNRRYYYDDSHGYKIYKEEETDEED